MSWIKEFRTTAIAAVAMAWGIFTGYEMYARARLRIPENLPIESVRAAMFIGGLIAAIVVCLSIKLVYEASKKGIARLKAHRLKEKVV